MDIEMRADMAPGWVTCVCCPATCSTVSSAYVTSVASVKYPVIPRVSRTPSPVPSLPIFTPSPSIRGRHHANRLQDIMISRRQPSPRLRPTKGCRSLSLRWSPQAAQSGKNSANTAKVATAIPRTPSPVGVMAASVSPATTPCRKIRSRHHQNRLQDTLEQRRRSPRLTPVQGCWSLSQRWTPEKPGGGTSPSAGPKGISRETGQKSEQMAAPEKTFTIKNVVQFGKFALQRNPETPPRGLKRERAIEDNGEADRSSQRATRSPKKTRIQTVLELAASTPIGGFDFDLQSEPDHVPCGVKRARALSDEGDADYQARQEDGYYDSLWNLSFPVSVAACRKKRVAVTTTPASEVKAKKEDEEDAQEPSLAPSSVGARGTGDDSPAGSPSPDEVEDTAHDHDVEAGEATLPSAATAPTRSRVYYYDVAYTQKLLQYLLCTSLPTLIAGIKHPKGGAAKAEAFKLARRWLDKTGLSDISHEFLEEIWADFAPDEDSEDSDEDEDSDDDDDDVLIGPFEMGQAVDKVFDEKIRPALGPRKEFKEVSQGLTSAQQRSLRKQLVEARKKYVKKHEGIGAQPFGL